MKKFLLPILAMLFMVSCSHDDEPALPEISTPGQSEQKDPTIQEDDSVKLPELNLPPLYGILVNVTWVYSGATCGPLWDNTPGDYDPKNPGPFDTVMVKDTYRGLWTSRLDGKLVSYLFPETRSIYEQFCLEWGVRMNADVDSTSVIASLPVNPHLCSFIAANHGIIGMDLITERDFDASHPAGSSVADITEINFLSAEPIFRNEADECETVVVCMKDVNATTIPRMGNLWFHVRLTRNPQKAGTYAFQQITYFSDGRVIKNRHKRVWLNEHLQKKPLQFPMIYGYTDN